MYYNNYNFPEYRAMEIDNQRAPETVTMLYIRQLF